MGAVRVVRAVRDADDAEFAYISFESPKHDYQIFQHMSLANSHPLLQCFLEVIDSTSSFYQLHGTTAAAFGDAVAVIAAVVAVAASGAGVAYIGF